MYGENSSMYGRLVFGPSMSVTVWPNMYLDAMQSVFTQPGEITYGDYCGIEDSQNLLKIQESVKRKKRRVIKKKIKKPRVVKKKVKLEVGVDKLNIIDDRMVRTDVLTTKRLVAMKEQKRKAVKSDKVVKRKKDIIDKPSEAIHCEVCEKTFKNNMAFGLHSIIHNNNERYSCHICNLKTISKHKFEKHINAHEGKAGFKCEICNKSFMVSTYATEHKYFHTGEKPFKCDVCGKDFMYSRLLSIHRRTRHWEALTGLPSTRYCCTICDKQYLSSTGLTRHHQRHHLVGFDQSKLCDICGKQLAGKDQLKFHRRIHTGYKPFSCNVCSKSFTRKDWLREHERVHTGERPYSCKFCQKGFTQRSPLKIHERTHTGEKPYVCIMCNRGFISKGIMDTHMKKCEGIVICDG